MTAPERLVRSPVFVLSAVRSGSTLLRAVLNQHTELCAPHELHLKDIDVQLKSDFSERTVRELGLEADGLRYLLWDRLMHHVLAGSGKRVFVNKTPTDVFAWRHIQRCWPDARYVFLLRHPAAIAESWDQAQIHWTSEEAVQDVLRYVTAVEDARGGLAGLTVRYEELTTAPEEQVRRICRFIGVPFEPAMLEYGARPEQRHFPAGLGDWSDKIQSGRPQPARPLPRTEDIPAALMETCRVWDYL